MEQKHSQTSFLQCVFYWGRAFINRYLFNNSKRISQMVCAGFLRVEPSEGELKMRSASEIINNASQKKHRKLLLNILFAGIVMFSQAMPGEAGAATATDNLNVTITIVGGCTINSIDHIDFGSQSLVGLSSPVTANGAVNVTCSTNHAYSVGLGAGAGDGATVAVRKMTQSGVGTIDYSLYQDAGYTTVWGETTGGGGNVVSGTGNGNQQTLTIYGQVPVPATAPAPGIYSDTVTVTVTY